MEQLESATHFPEPATDNAIDDETDDGFVSQESCSSWDQSSSFKPLQIVYGSLKHSWLLPTSIYFQAAHLKDEFVADLYIAATEARQHGELSSAAELAILFMGHLLKDLELTEDKFNVTKQVLANVLDQFDATFLKNEEITTLVTGLVQEYRWMLELLRIYFKTLHVLNRPVRSYDSNLLRAARRGEASVYAIFGGQGNTDDYFSELREIYSTYPHLIHDFIVQGSNALQELCVASEAEAMYPQGFNVIRWLQRPDEQPHSDYLMSCPISFPLIGFLQLVQYALTCKLFGIDPGALRARLSGSSGHSQGISAALVVSISGSWESFYDSTMKMLTVLFWIGLRSQQYFVPASPPPYLVQESIMHGEGVPTPMLSIRNLPRKNLNHCLDLTNRYLPSSKRVYVGLINSRNSYVAVGPPLSLCGLNSHLREIKADGSLDQTRIPYSQRKFIFTNVFLPISAPFHSPYLEAACEQVIRDLRAVSFPSKCLYLSVYDTIDGGDLRNDTEENLTPRLVKMIMCDPVHWELATGFPGATHVLDFGPGRNFGAGLITHQIKEGAGIRIISTGSFDNRTTGLGSRDELFGRNRQHPVKYASNWLQQCGPRLVRTTSGKTFVDTKFSRLMGLPHIMVAGMTPCTVHWDFVAATMNGGYHIELAGGGYYDAPTMAMAIRKIGESVVPGRSITVNLIYVSPQNMAWQIPLLKQLRAEGIPVDGLTIGAGVPAPEVADQYITGLGLRHISFKPGSARGIQEVIDIAKAHDHFPVILQWTGGRGGGHHSYEDFHQPIIQMYAKIRDCSNIILVAGSGFGGAEDTYPYITGNWAVDLNLSPVPMPFDGILFGSRMMIAKEAHTSRAAKEAIVSAEGSDDLSWEKTYSGPHGGVMNVRSEVREPIHKIATRGVKLWAELDKTIFTLEKAKRVPELQRRRDEIINRLNRDYQKVWFGKSSTGAPVDVDEMTYAEVMHRLIELMYIKHQSRWIDTSYRMLLGDFIRRVEERFMSKAQSSLVQDYSELQDPFFLIQQIVSTYPECHQLVNFEDSQYFLLLCQKRGRKPVPFVPALDENFENWFKKDSLWQCEDIEAVVDQDVGRTCILHGPVAAQYSKVVDEPVKDILDRICEAHVQKLMKDLYPSGGLPIIDFFGGNPVNHSHNSETDRYQVISTRDLVVYHLNQLYHKKLPNPGSWLEMLGGESFSWRYALFNSSFIVQGLKITDNLIKRIFAPTWGMEVEIIYPHEPARTIIKVRERCGADDKALDLIEVSTTSSSDISLVLYEHRNILRQDTGLLLRFTYHSEAGFAPIREVMEDRNTRVKEFYHRIWFGNEPAPLDASPMDCFDGGEVVVEHKAVIDFVNAIGNSNEAYSDAHGDKSTYAPMDFAIKATFKAMTAPFFLKAMDGDLLKNVHLENGFRMLPNAIPLKIGDTIKITSHVDSIMIQDSGKTVQTSGIITRDGVSVMEVISRCMYRGNYSDFENTFQRKHEKVMILHLAKPEHVAQLQAREWFQLKNHNTELLGKTLTFRLESLIRFQNGDIWSSVMTKGEVFEEVAEKISRIATVQYEAGRSYGNPVVDYLERHGRPAEQRNIFDQAIPLHATALTTTAPSSNELYARASGDYNPIHVSRIFSIYAGHAGTITHGMYTSAVVRSYVESWAAENDINRIRSFKCSFVGIVLPQDQIDVKLWHVGMVSGRMLVKVEATNNLDEKVLVGEAEVEQSETAYIFTGQGSQRQNMGLDLYSQNSIAKEVWDRADRHLLNLFGKSSPSQSYITRQSLWII